jgi:two-component system response regulator DesR
VIRVLLADHENPIRSALASLLALQDDLEVVAQAAAGDEALAMARRYHPDVAVLDLQMPGLDGIAVAEALVRDLPGCASLILTSHGRPGHLKRALAAGIRGFLPKTVSAQVLADVVRTVHRGGRYVDPELAADAKTATKRSRWRAPTAGSDGGVRSAGRRSSSRAHISQGRRRPARCRERVPGRDW